MAGRTVHKGDVGTTFRARVKDGAYAVDLTGATTLEFVFKAPSAALKTFTGSVSGDAKFGKFEYITLLDTDLDEVGTWQWQPHIVLPSGEWRGEVRTFDVLANLE